MTMSLRPWFPNYYSPILGWTRDVCIDICTHIRLTLHSAYPLCPQEAKPQLAIRDCTHPQRSFRHISRSNSVPLGRCQDQWNHHLALRRQGSRAFASGRLAHQVQWNRHNQRNRHCDWYRQHTQRPGREPEQPRLLLRWTSIFFEQLGKLQHYSVPVSYCKY